LNRIDAIIAFSALSREDLQEIVEIQVRGLAQMLAERRIELKLTDEAKAHIAEVGYDPAYGARPLKRTLQRLVADPLALAILEGDFGEGDAVVVDVDGQGLVFRDG
jgi:ATP-dependent Clp protease ATP-binding subunit ClpB